VIDLESTLTDIRFAVSGALDSHGISGVLVGGSAASVYAPKAYLSHDADFILDANDPLPAVAIALDSIGFKRDGRSRLFVHPGTEYTR
jgi:hypothetical protein